jgi:CRISPR-associated protein Csm4
MELTIYHLSFPGGFHLGTRGVNLEESAVTLPSGTLFAALIATYRLCGGDPDAFVAPFSPDSAKDPLTVHTAPFLLSSAFLYAGDVLFFPMPSPLDRFFSPETLQARRKALKGIRFISEALLRDVLAHRRLDNRLFPENPKRDPIDGVALQGGTLWLTKEEVTSLPSSLRQDAKTGRSLPSRALRHHAAYQTACVPRVRVDRVNSASEIFHAGRVSFAPGCGLWFGVHWRHPDAELDGRPLQSVFESLLSVLQEEGLGGERSAGYGCFICNATTSCSLPDPEEGGLAFLLSRYHPQLEELPTALRGHAAYTLVPVSGWLRSWDAAAQRRKRLWLVEAGSLIQTTGPGPWGDVVDVRPDYGNARGVPHPVWRYGLALGVGCAVKEVERE